MNVLGDAEELEKLKEERLCWSASRWKEGA